MLTHYQVYTYRHGPCARLYRHKASKSRQSLRQGMPWLVLFTNIRYETYPRYSSNAGTGTRNGRHRVIGKSSSQKKIAKCELQGIRIGKRYNDNLENRCVAHVCHLMFPRSPHINRKRREWLTIHASLPTLYVTARRSNLAVRQRIRACCALHSPPTPKSSGSTLL